MKKYIDGEKLKYRMNGARESVESGKEAFELVAHWLEIIPPEDVVAVVRCKYGIDSIDKMFYNIQKGGI